jgi:hypothetical protein
MRGLWIMRGLGRRVRRYAAYTTNPAHSMSRPQSPTPPTQTRTPILHACTTITTTIITITITTAITTALPPHRHTQPTPPRIGYNQRRSTSSQTRILIMPTRSSRGIRARARAKRSRGRGRSLLRLLIIRCGSTLG